MINYNALAKLCDQAKIETQYQDVSRLDQIKKLTQQLMKQCYKQDDAAGYAKIVSTALDYINAIPNNRPDFLASIFELAHDDMDLARYALKQSGDLLKWNMIQHHDLDKYAIELEKNPKNIQAFLNNVMQEIGVDHNRVMMPVNELVSQLSKSFDSDDLQALHLYSDIFNLDIKYAFQMGDPDRMAELLIGIMPICEKCMQMGHYELLQSIFNLNAEEVKELHACYEVGAKPLVNWMLVDDLLVEKYAKEMEIEREGVQNLKQHILKKMGTPKPLKTPDKVALDYLRAMKRQDEEAITALDTEGDCILLDSFLNDDVQTYAEFTKIMLNHIKVAAAEGDYSTIIEVLDINSQNLEEFLIYINNDDDLAALYFIIQNDDLDNTAFKYAVNLDNKDAVRTVNFKARCYSYLNPSHGPVDKAAAESLTLSAKQIQSLIDDVLASGKMDLLEYVEYKNDQALQNAFQQNNMDEYLAILNLNVQTLGMLLKNDSATLMASLDMNKDRREKLLYHLQKDNSEVCMAILMEENFEFHQGFKYSAHKENQDFQKRALKELNLEKIPELDIELDKLHPGHFEQDDFIPYWASHLETLAEKFDPEKTMQFRQQIQKRMQQCFKEDDVEGYVQAATLINELRDTCLKTENVGAISMLLRINAEDIKPTLQLIERQNLPYMHWLTLQQHELEEVCLRGTKKYEEVGPFLNSVYKSLSIKPDDCFRPVRQIAIDLKQALENNNSDDINYFSDEIKDLLKKDIFANNAKGAAKTIDEMVDLIEYANSIGRFDKVSRIIQIENVEPKIIEECLKQGRKDLIKLAYTNSYHLQETMRYIGEKQKRSDLRVQIENNVEVNRIAVFSSIGSLTRLVKDALKTNNVQALKLLNFECEVMMKHAFLSNDVNMFAKLSRMYLDIIQKATELRRTDLVIEHFDFDTDYVELINLMRDSLEHNYEEKDFKNICLYEIIQDQNLEHIGILFGIKDQSIQEFKRQVHQQLLGQPDELLLCPMHWITTQGEKLIAALGYDRLERLLWDAQVEAHLEFAFEQKDPSHYSKIILRVQDLLENAFNSNNIDILLDNIDFTFEERDVLFHHLQHKNREGSLQVLTECTLKKYKKGFDEKFGYRHDPDFRMNLYQALNIKPALKSLMDKPDESLKITPLIGDINAYEQLEWLRKNADSIDLDNNFTQEVLKEIAKNDLAVSAIDFLEVTNTENSNLAANIIKAFRHERMLSHRLSLPGVRIVQGVPIDVEGGHENDMVRQLQETMGYHYADLTALEDSLQGLYDKPINMSELSDAIRNDLDSVSLRMNADTLEQALNENKVVNIPVSLACDQDDEFDSKQEWHAVVDTFFKDYCLMSDRSRHGEDSKQGLILCRVKNKKDKKDLYTDLCESSQKYLSVDTTQHDHYLTEQLDLQVLDHIPMPEQTAGSCTWTSCAEMMHLATVFCRLIEVGVKQGLKEGEAIAKAKQGAQRIHEQFMSQDVNRLVDQYLSFRESSELEFDNVTLAMTFLKCEHNPNLKSVAEKINDSKLINHKDLSQAQEILVENFKNHMIPNNIKQLPDPDNSLDSFARRVVDLYLHNQIEDAHVVYETYCETALHQAQIAEQSQKKREKEAAEQGQTFSRREAALQFATTPSTSSITENPKSDGDPEKIKPVKGKRV